MPLTRPILWALPPVLFFHFDIWGSTFLYPNSQHWQTCRFSWTCTMREVTSFFPYCRMLSRLTIQECWKRIQWVTHSITKHNSVLYFVAYTTCGEARDRLVRYGKEKMGCRNAGGGPESTNIYKFTAQKKTDAEFIAKKNYLCKITKQALQDYRHQTDAGA